MNSVLCVACRNEIVVPISIRFQKDGFEIARCSSCGLMFRTELPGPGELDRIYDGSYFSSAIGDTRGQGYDDYLGDAELHQEVARDRLKLLSRFAGPGRLLDVGSAAGFFVAEARLAGWDAQGIDIAAEIVAWGREHLQVPLSRTTLAGVEPTAGPFEAVTMWDYIEHATDPAGDLLRSHDLLRSGGILALSTGDAASLAARLSGRRWHLLTPRHHNYYFTDKSLSVFLARHGFEILHARHPGVRYSAGYLAYKLRTMLDIYPVRLAAESIKRSKVGALKVPLNLCDIITVVARRR